MKSTCIAVFVAVVLILVTSPSTSAACAEMTADNFNYSTYHNEAAVPTCCLTVDCMLLHHSLTNVVDNEVILPDQSTPKENVYLVWFITSVTTENSLNTKKPFQREPIQELPSYLYTEYHCRNCLDSEEPLQV
jgi:hypothetical protein